MKYWLLLVIESNSLYSSPKLFTKQTAAIDAFIHEMEIRGIKEELSNNSELFHVSDHSDPCKYVDIYLEEVNV